MNTYLWCDCTKCNTASTSAATVCCWLCCWRAAGVLLAACAAADYDADYAADCVAGCAADDMCRLAVLLLTHAPCMPSRQAILVNKVTASTSELLAGALHDDYGALLVGETTFGKGRTQRIITLTDGSTLLVSTVVSVTDCMTLRACMSLSVSHCVCMCVFGSSSRCHSWNTKIL